MSVCLTRRVIQYYQQHHELGSQIEYDEILQRLIKLSMF